MLYPTIHINGTSADVLLSQMSAAAAALTKGLRALEAAAPHARDYYVQGSDAYQAATREHGARVAKVAQVIADLEAIGVHIIRQE